MKSKPKVLVVLGPTATGKSALAVHLAKKLNGEVISADSRQIYRGMDLGTGKITKKEMGGVKHHLLDVVNPNTIFSVSKYKQLAESAIEEILSKKTSLNSQVFKNVVFKDKLPIICGGTGFYIDSIVKNISLPEVKPNKKLRKELGKKTAEKLFEMLKKLSPYRTKSIDRHNKVRLIRAIEIAKALGEVPEIKEGISKYDFIFVGLDLPDKKLKQNIAIRLFARIRSGMVDEVKRLHKSGVLWKRLESFGLEYRQIALYLQNKISKQEMLKNLEIEIWHYAKRQRTWFKKNRDIKWFRPEEKIRIINYLKNKILS